MKQAHHILVVDDDAEINSLLCNYLSRFGFVVHAAGDGPSMHEQLARQHIDLIVLDLQLPGEDGVSLARNLRTTNDVPIVMLTARSSPIDRVIGLEVGADDYMSKPFEPRELVARIQVVLRRARGQRDEPVSRDVIRFDGWQLVRKERSLTSPKGLSVPLSNAEYQLLSTFLKAPRHLLTRDQLMHQTRGQGLGPEARSIDLLVSRLRHKLDDDARDPTLIQTVRGGGYVFNVKQIQRQAECRP
jgi:two-component system OmpR family response regulator